MQMQTDKKEDTNTRKRGHQVPSFLLVYPTSAVRARL